MDKLHYEVNTYYQDGKPEAPAGVEYSGLNNIEPLMVEYFTERGRGTLKLNLVRFFPANAHDLKTFIDILNMARDTYAAADQVYTYLHNVIEDLKKFRLADVYSDEDKKNNAKITGFIKKYLSNINKIADAFGFESVKDQETESSKMSKTRVVVCETMNGKTYAREYDGKQFRKGGSVWHVYKYAKGVFRVAMPGTGFYVLEYCGKISEAPAFITPDIFRKLENVRKNNPRAFLELAEKANNICEGSGVENTSLPDYFAPVETEPAPAPAPVKSVTTEPAPAVDEEKKPVKNVIKRDTTILSGTILIDTSFDVKGDVVDVFKDRYGWTGINRRTGKIALFPASFLRNGEIFRIDAQRPEPTTENISRLLDAGNEEEARKELFALLVVSGERAMVETNRKHGEILETSETKELLEKIAKEAEKTASEYFAPVETETTTDRHKAPATVSEPNQETGNRPQIVEQITTKETRNRAPYYIITRAERPQVWEPCTMTKHAKNGIIYAGNCAKTRTGSRQKTERVKRLKTACKILGYTNIPLIDKNPVTGTEQSHKAMSKLAAYAHGRPPDPDRLRQKQVKYYN